MLNSMAILYVCVYPVAIYIVFVEEFRKFYECFAID